MRELKFRVWNPHLKVMSYNFEEINVTGHDIIGNVESGLMKAQYKDNTGWQSAHLMQYIGIKDNNEKNIYEADIVSFTDKDDADTFLPGRIGVVIFRNGSFMIKRDTFNFYRWMDYKVEVIGNIYENYKLLGR